MPITEDQYKKLSQHIKENCTTPEIKLILKGDFSPLRTLIIDELLLVDYQGTIIDVIFEDLFSQKKKPFLKRELGEFADFLISDLSLYYLKRHLEQLVK